MPIWLRWYWIVIALLCPIMAFITDGATSDKYHILTVIAAAVITIKHEEFLG